MAVHSSTQVGAGPFEHQSTDFSSKTVQQLKDDLELAERKYRRLFEGSKDLIFITNNEIG